ncbi:MAG: sugar phosphate nucleotidyltransferase [Candidatus Sumerlaeota bacterium]|nr:sugar phosphate nucleotidyltransferase [Candidatus Sumerlaeota bacterium]
MKAIIPVAGMGTRLRPHTHTAPKVLLHVAGKSILGHIVDELLSLNVTDITFIVGYLGKMVENYIQKNYPMIQAHFVEQDEPNGLGHAIWLTRGHFPGDEPLLIILGDTIFQADLASALQSRHTVIGVKAVEDARRFGVVELGMDGFAAALVEKPDKPKSNLAIVGIYVIRSSSLLFQCLEDMIHEDRRTRGEFQLTDSLQEMLRRGEKIGTFPVEGWFDCGNPETMLETNRVLLTRNRVHHGAQSEQFPDSIIVPPVSISPRARIIRSIVGPYVSVSDDAEVNHSIVSDSIISEGAVVANILLDSSIISNNARVNGHHSRLNVGDSSEISLE